MLSGKSIVRILYRLLLAREPSAAEIALHRQGLRRGKTVQDIAAAVLETSEFNAIKATNSFVKAAANTDHDRAVRTIFSLLLDREPKEGELEEYRAMAISEVPVARIVDRLVEAPSFAKEADVAPALRAASRFNRWEAINAVYQTLLNRAPDDEEIRYHHERLNSGLSIKELSAELLASDECSEQALHNPLIKAASKLAHWRSIEVVYRILLEREPSSAEVADLYRRFGEGMSVNQLVAELIKSDEFRANILGPSVLRTAGRSDPADVVRAVYLLLFNREADVFGLEHYRNAMIQGLSLSEMIVELVASQEFVQNAANLPIVRAAIDSRAWLEFQKQKPLPVSASREKTFRPTIFIECSHTVESDINTGIQRVVRNIIRNAPTVAAQYGFDVIPVVLESGSFSQANIGKLFADKQQRDGEIPFRSGEPYYLDRFASHQGNILLLLDSSWGMNIWPAVARFKDRGGYIAGTIYDLIPVTHSHTSVAALVLAFQRWLEFHAILTDSLVAISHSVKNQVEEYFASNEEKADIPIGYFHLGAELDFIDDASPVSLDFERIFSTSLPTFIVVGTIEPRKKHEDIFEAFELLWSRGVEASLVIIGKRDWKSDELLERIASHSHLGTCLHLIRSATDADLDFAYKNASALIIASEVEGFGLPIVEAFQRGLPVLCSDIAVFKEIAEGRASMFRVGDPASMVETIERFIAELKQGNVSRAPQPWISWQESTEQLLRAIMKEFKRRAPKPWSLEEVCE